MLRLGGETWRHNKAIKRWREAPPRAGRQGCPGRRKAQRPPGWACGAQGFPGHSWKRPAGEPRSFLRLRLEAGGLGDAGDTRF